MPGTGLPASGKENVTGFAQAGPGSRLPGLPSDPQVDWGVPAEQAHAPERADRAFSLDRRSYLPLSFFLFRFSLSVSLAFFWSSLLPLSRFPLSPISNPFHLGMAQPDVPFLL